MNEIIISAAISFAATFLIAPKTIKYFKEVGIIAVDQHKPKKPVLPTSQGVAVALGILAGIFSYIGITTFVTGNGSSLVELFAATCTILTITMIGFIDDIFVGKRKVMSKTGSLDYRIGLRQSTKALLVLPAAIPLMVINAGQSTMVLPLIGAVDFGIIYPLMLIPIGVLCVANAVNMLGGVNGVESGMTLIALLGLGLFAAMVGEKTAAVIALVGAAGFLGIMHYAWTPSKILPGDVTTYLAGALIATVVIVGNIERFGIIVFLPWIIEAFIKAKQRFRGTCMARVSSEGYLKPKNGCIESLVHVVESLGEFKEKQVASVLIISEVACVCLAFGMYFAGVI